MAKNFVQLKGVQKPCTSKNHIVCELRLASGKEKSLTTLSALGSNNTTILMMLTGFRPVTYGQMHGLKD